MNSKARKTLKTYFVPSASKNSASICDATEYRDKSQPEFYTKNLSKRNAKNPPKHRARKIRVILPPHDQYYTGFWRRSISPKYFSLSDTLQPWSSQEDGTYSPWRNSPQPSLYIYIYCTMIQTATTIRYDHILL